MAGTKRVFLFGGQGSPALFSQQAASSAIEDARSSSTAAILLSRCHSAFLEEVQSLGSRKKQVFPDQIDALQSVDKFLVPEPGYRDNGIIQGTTICLYQLLSYIASLERRQASITSTHHEILETTGFCSGLLPAIVVASSRTAKEFVEIGVEAFRLAFWIGYRSTLYCQSILGGRYKELPWLLVVMGLDRDQVSDKLQKFQAESEHQRLHIAAISSEHCISISGPGPELLAFKAQCSAPVSANFAHVHASYHGGIGMQGVIDEVCHDIDDRDITFPRLVEGQKPIRSTLDGSYLTSSEHSNRSFTIEALRLLLYSPVDWHRTMEMMSTSVNVLLDKDPTMTVQMSSIGPNTNSLLYGIKRDPNMNTRAQVIDHTHVAEALKAVPLYARNDIAIVGMGVNFPKGKGLNELWETLSSGLSTVEEIPKSRFELAQFHNLDPKHSKKRTMATRHGNFLDDASAFDPSFFNISPREAKSMDPQQRLLLRTALSALEDSGYAEDSTPSFQKDSFGCYIGVATGDYVDNLRDDIDVYYSTGTLRAFLSGKISYAFNWSGPSMVVDTACSSSAVSIYHACRALQNGDCHGAIAGGVNVITSPDVCAPIFPKIFQANFRPTCQMYLGLSRAHFLSPTGQCKPFDEAADGYSRAEGCGIFVLKRLSDAIAENDRIHGIIKSIEVNQCGNAQSITHPHAETQAALFTRVLQKAGVDSQSVSVVEAHGTGTQVIELSSSITNLRSQTLLTVSQAGDMAECTSLQSIFGRSRNDSNPLIVSSIKGNIGHTEAASGAAGLAKLLLMLRRKTIPVQASLSYLNPRLMPLLAGTIKIPRETQPWSRGSTQPRRALLNNFGAAGSNVALLLEEYVGAKSQAIMSVPRTAYPFNLSARSQEALKKLVFEHRQLLLKKSFLARIEDICYAACARRQIYEHRLSVTCSSSEELIQKLTTANTDVPRITLSPSPTVFVFSGQGSSYYGMAQELIENSPVFKRTINYCDDYLQSLGFPSILRLLQSKTKDSPSSSAEDEVVGFQCACVIVEYALAKLWISWNIIPDIVFGHSLGEYTALAISGAVSLEDVLKLVALRARLMMSHCQRATSGMLICRYSAIKVEHILATSSSFSQLTVACSNSSSDCVLAGSLQDLENFESHCSKTGIKAKRLLVPYGFHSSFMDPIVEPLKDLGKSIKFSEPAIAIGSNVLGKIITLQDLNSEYFAKHARQTVRFYDLIKDAESQGMLENATFLEVGPHPITLPMLKTSLSGKQCRYLPTLHKEKDAWLSVSEALGQFFTSRDGLNWREVFDGVGAKLVDLPGHPLSMAEYGMKYKEPTAPTLFEEPTVPETKTSYTLLPRALPLESTEDCKVFETNLQTLGNHIRGHAVGGVAICPASIYHEMVLEAAQAIQSLSADAVYSVSNMTFVSPLLYNASKELDPIRVHLSKTSLPTKLDFKVISFNADTKHETVHCSGVVAASDVSKLQSKFARKSAMVKLQEEHLFAGPGHTLNTFQTQMLYKTIFTRVVVYSEQYHSLQSLCVSKSNSEGYGTFRLPPQPYSIESLSSPTFIDTMLHTAGFIANISVPLTEICVCGKVESVQLLYNTIDFGGTFTIYCTLFDDGEGTIIANASALDINGKVVAFIKGMHFKKLRLSAFKVHLERLTGGLKAIEHSTAGTISGNSSLFTQLAIKESSISVPATNATANQFDVKVNLFKVISELCGVPVKVLESSRELTALGIDSLMLLELHSALKTQFPTHHLDESALHNCQTLRDLEDMFVSSLTISRKQSEPNANLVSTTIHLSHEVKSATAFTKGEAKGGKVRTVLQAVCELDDVHTPSDRTLDSLGIDSLMMIELEHALQRELGSTIQPDKIRSSRTIQDLEDLEESFTPTPEETTTAATSPADMEDVFRMQQLPLPLQIFQSPNRPLFLVHDGSGLCDVYRRIQPLHRNLYGFYNPSLFTNVSGPKSLVEMASNYAAHVTSTSNGPVIIGGWSFGGVVAFEMARLLQSAGKRVDGVILIDSPYPIDHQPLPDPVIAHLTGSFHPSVAIAADSPTRARRKQVLQQFQTNAGMLGQYTPGPHTPLFKVVMLRSRDTFDSERLCGVRYPWLGEQKARDEAIAGWRTLLGSEMPVLEIPGNHFDVFAKANIPEVSRQIQAACSIIEA
ncbi:hypothetical protein MMC27_002042 [Xylographa pallens]|nr:hypothetical protein [Xylographa pallens]